MQFVTDLSKKEYTAFFNKFPYSHFLQSYAWGETNKETRGKTPCYVGLKDDKNKLVAAALLLKKEMPLGLCYYYCPRGYLIDFKDTKLVKTFTDEIRNYLKENNAIYLKINPEIMYQEIDDNGNPIPNGKNNLDIFNNLISLGYKHKGFVKLYENNEPRYTFRRYFAKYNSMEEIDQSISKTFMKTVRRSYTYDLKVNCDANVDEFFELNKSNAAKDNFVQYSDKFYRTLYKYGHKEGNVLVFEISVNAKKLYKETKEAFNKMNDDFANDRINKKQMADALNKKNRIEKEVEMFEPYKNEDNVVICSMINGIANDQMWTMYIGNNKLGEDLFAVNRVYYETIKYCFEHKYRFLDLYGTIGNPNVKFKNLGGLHDYKKKFGDTYIEFIGEFDLVNKPLWYTILPVLLKIYRKIKR